jgi:hypothetical protein
MSMHLCLHTTDKPYTRGHKQTHAHACTHVDAHFGTPVNTHTHTHTYLSLASFSVVDSLMKVDGGVWHLGHGLDIGSPSGRFLCVCVCVTVVMIDGCPPIFHTNTHTVTDVNTYHL